MQLRTSESANETLLPPPSNEDEKSASQVGRASRLSEGCQTRSTSTVRKSSQRMNPSHNPFVASHDSLTICRQPKTSCYEPLSNGDDDDKKTALLGPYIGELA